MDYYDLQGTGIRLRDYQVNAVNKTDKIFENNRFASVILPTGGGKTYVAMTELLNFGKTEEELVEEQERFQNKEIPHLRNDRTMLYLAPSNEILEQTKDRIIETIHGKVKTVGRKSKDDIVKDIFPNIKFATYQSLLSSKGKDIINPNYDFIIFDELHRTGAEKWEEKIDKLLDNQREDTKVLGITATPRRDVDDRNMSHKMAEKLGYTEEEINKGKHIAIDLELEDAIKLGLVVNPKIVYCEYTLKQNGSMENLLENINSMPDGPEKEEEIKKYEALKRNLDRAEGIPEILKSNIKQGGKYIVFIPPTSEGEEKLVGQEKIDEYIRKLQDEYLKDTGIQAKCYSMIGGKDKANAKQLDKFEHEEVEETKFMVVMDKANEGLHIDGIDGIVWLRPLDENSRILYLQQLGRVIYSEDPNNLTPEYKRPVVIDLVNTTVNVNIDKKMKENSDSDDLSLLTIIVDWAVEHDALPDIESSSKKEQRYAATLYRIQNKYEQYVNGFEEFPDLEEEKKENIKNILEKGAEVELWDVQLEPKTKEQIDRIINVDTFEVNGIMKDFVDMEDSINEIEMANVTEKFINKMQKIAEVGVDVSQIQSRDTIQTLAEKSGIIMNEEQAKELGIKLDDKIGSTKNNIAKAYRGNGRGKRPTEEQVQILLELGISLERIERDKTQEFIKKLEILTKLGIDVSPIQCRDTIQTLAEKSGIIMNEEQAKELGIKLDDKIGSTKNNIAKAYRGNGRGKRPTEEQVQILLEFGISLESRSRTGKEIAEASIGSLKNIEMADKEDSALKELVEKTKEGGIKRDEQS